MPEYLLNKLNDIIQNDEIQEGFELEKELKEKNEHTALYHKLEGYLLPWISSAQFEDLMQNHLINLSQIQDIDLKARLNLRILPFPEDSQDLVKLDCLKMLLKNKQIIGKMNISQWLKEYEKFVNYKQGTSLDRKKFIDDNKDTKALASEEKNILIKIIDVFDFIKPSFDYKDDIINQKNADMSSAKPSVTNNNPVESNISPEPKLEKISVSDALKTYPELGEQLITSSHIKLQNFPDPARPSVKNWLFDYTFNMGHDPHNSMVRGSYLFQNENTKRLSSSERQKLAFVLKAYDENTEVTVSLTTKQIVFPKTSEQRTASSEQKTTNNFRNSGLTQNNPYENRQHISQAPSADNPNIPSTKLNFSSPQKMPFENQPRGPQPIRIVPHDNLNRNTKPSPKNVVNLKE